MLDNPPALRSPEPEQRKLLLDLEPEGAILGAKIGREAGILIAAALRIVLSMTALAFIIRGVTLVLQFCFG